MELHDRYSTVARLDIDSQRELLHGGDAIERVWAAWALGAALGVQATPDLVIEVHESPSPGTRQHLLVMLAGLGASDLLRVFAQDDPDDDVRATACRYLIRTSPAGDLDIRRFIHQRLLEDPSPTVRHTILIEAPADFPEIRFDDLRELIRDPSSVVRRVALERLFATGIFQHLVLDILLDRIANEVDIDLRTRLLAQTLVAGGATRMLQLGTTLPSDHAAEILRSLVVQRVQFSWVTMNPLIHNYDPELAGLLVGLFDPASNFAALPWLLERFGSSYVIGMLISELPRIHAGEKIILHPDQVYQLIAELYDEIVEIQNEGGYDYLAYDPEEGIKYRKELIAALQDATFLPPA